MAKKQSFFDFFTNCSYDSNESESEGKRLKPTPLPHMRLWFSVGKKRFSNLKEGIYIGGYKSPIWDFFALSDFSVSLKKIIFRRLNVFTLEGVPTCAVLDSFCKLKSRFHREPVQSMPLRSFLPWNDSLSTISLSYLCMIVSISFAILWIRCYFSLCKHSYIF